MKAYRLAVSALMGLSISIATADHASAKDLGYLEFEGSYKLVRSVRGMCETILAIYRQSDDENQKNMFVGSFLMRNIDGGQEIYEDLFVKRRINTTIRGNVLESRQVNWDKSLKRTTTKRYGVKKSGKTLTMWNYTNLHSSLPMKCVYRFVSEEPIKLPWDPGLAE